MDVDLLSQFRLIGLPAPVMELVFHPERKWRFDYAWPEYVLAVEIEGGVGKRGKDGQVGGRHNREKGYTGDCRKYNAAQLLGWKVLRFTTAMVKSGEMFSTLKTYATNIRSASK